jgi:transcriptional regulator with XRE-family HTH domain
MKLGTYITDKGMTDASFGALAGISQSQVSRIRRGISWPTSETVEAIVKATKGKVTAQDLYQMKAEAAQ